MAKRQKRNTNLLEIQNAAKTMFANVRFQSIDKPLRSILMTSSVPDEGKTTTAWYLAQAAATAGHAVLLVECDMRRRSVANMLQLHPEHGIFEVLTGGIRLEDAIVPTSVRNLFFLDAEPSIPNPADLLASNRMLQLNEALLRKFDYVVYDTPPVGTFVDAAVLGGVVDACILVVRPGHVKRDELLKGYDQMRSADANVIGVCATFVDGADSSYYYYSYYTKDKKSNDDSSIAEAQAPIDLGEAAMGEVLAPPPARARGRHDAKTARTISVPRGVAPNRERSSTPNVTDNGGS